MNRRIAAGLAAAILWLPSAAWAQELADVGQLAQFIRWGGVTASVFVIAGAMVLLRLVSDLSQRLSARFVHRRPTLQKAESITRFSIYLLTVIVCVAES